MEDAVWFAVGEALCDGARGVGVPRPPAGLACSRCRWIPWPPVTLPCGHTLCRPCLPSPGGGCPLCRHPTAPHGAPPPSDNVLVKAALNKWMAPELAAARLRELAANALRIGHLDTALDKLHSAIQTCPNDHLSLDARAEVLYRMGDYESSLKDAENIVRLRPLWPKGYLRRGAALVALGHPDRALVSYLLYVASSKNSESVKNEINKIIYMMVGGSMNSKDNIESEVASLFPWWFPQSPMHFQPKIGQEGSSFEYSRLHLVIERAFYEIDKLKRVECEPGELHLRMDCVDAGDFECVLCCRVLWRPVTTPCGHTYCSMCLDRCLDYSSNCPLCMTSLADYLSTSERHVTDFLEAALVGSLPQEYACRLLSNQQEQTALLHTSDLPVFVCTTAFPTVPCPLFVFEPKYRLLVRRAVASGHRRFAMAACVSQQSGPNRYAEYGTVLEIKDWLLLNDGCSILSNIGGKRFRVVRRAERDGYDIAQVQYLIDDPIPVEHLKEVTLLHDQVRERGSRWFNRLRLETQCEIVRTFGDMPKTESNWVSLSDGPSWAWWLLAILPLGTQLQVGILGTVSLKKRLRAIDKTLRHLEGDQLLHQIPVPILPPDNPQPMQLV